MPTSRDLIAQLRAELDRAERELRTDSLGNPGESAGNGEFAERKFREALEALTSGEADFSGAGMSVTTASQREQESLQRSRAAGPDRREQDPRLEDGIDRFNTQGQRADALYRRHDAQLEQMRRLVNRMGREPTIAERNELANARVRADGVYASLGRVLPEWLRGESPRSYRSRLVGGIQDMCAALKNARLDSIADDAFAVAEERIYRDAAMAGKCGRGIGPMQLRPHQYQDATTYHNITEYFGDPMAWMSPFMSPGARIRVNKTPRGCELE